MDDVLGFPSHSVDTPSIGPDDFIETPNDRDWASKIAPEPTPVGEQLRNASDHIGKTLNDIANGITGEHPVIDALVSKNPQRYAICNDYCEHKRKHDDELFHRLYDNPPQPLISDVKPSTKERLYNVERDVQDVSRDINRLEATIARYDERSANREDLFALENRMEKKTEHAHLRIDRDVMPEIKSLRSKRVFKDVVLVTSLVVSILVNVIMTYTNYIQK